MRSLGALAVVVFLLFSPVRAQGDNGAAAAAGEKLAVSGSVEFETAEMLKARKHGMTTGGNLTPTGTVDHVWFGHAIGTFTVSSSPAENLNVRASFELRQYFMTMLRPQNIQDQYLGRYQYTGFYLREGQGIFSLFKKEALSADLAVGLMPYKYNPEVRNLGEYLFRSGTYPLFLLGEFDRPFARVTGARTGMKYRGKAFDAGLDLLALIEREVRPFNDISIALVGNITFLNMFDFGAGIDFARVIPVSDTLTTPVDDPLTAEIEYESNRYVDPASGDTGSYTFKGTKIMARLTIDPFRQLRGDKGSLVSRILGESGGKVYGEIAAIGLKNYPANQIAGADGNPKGYASLEERTPWMAGVTLPTWTILDECVFEIERFPSPNPDDFMVSCYKGMPLPSQTLGPGYAPADYAPRWNWSLYMKRRITSGFSAVFQAGRDHQRWETHMVQSFDYDFEAAMVKPDHWGWHLSGIFNF